MRILRQPRNRLSANANSAPGVMFFINDLGMGGAERALVSLVNNARQFRPVIALLRPVLDLADELDPDIEIILVGPTGGAAATTASSTPRGRPRGQMVLELPGLLRTASDLAHAARAADCKVISTFLNRAHTVALTSRMLFDSRLRIVVNVHELLSAHLDMHFASSERRLMQKFITRMFPKADRIVTVADAVTTDLIRNFGLPPSRITVVHNPVDRVRIGRASSATVDETLFRGNTLVGVGRLVKLKGFDVLIRAMARLPADLDARLVIAGDGVERGALERLVSELGLGDRVKLLGVQPNPWQYMARAKALVVPSRTEAFPTVIGEAFTLSVPVVATRCSDGVADYLEHGRAGLLVPTEDVDALATALERILRDPALRRRLAIAGRKRVEAFDMPLAVRRYEDLMLEVGSIAPTSRLAAPPIIRSQDRHRYRTPV
ncbi:MAG TPA: glycosyltransferase [Gemmatimonadaceae bacterium]|nr:glycosyltransferase [Gemmatimonadaceae bacterium]